MNFGEWLEEHRAKRKLLKKQLLMRIAISDSHLRALVNGQQPKLHTFVRICERLGEKPEDVLAKLNDFGDRK